MKQILWIICLFSSNLSGQGMDRRAQIISALDRGVDFFYTLNTHGGYVYHITPDLSLRWGEGLLDSHTIEVQPPGTPAVGQSFLSVYKITGNLTALQAAREAAQALIKGQNIHGGWNHQIDFADLSDETVSLDDNQSQSAISFLMALDKEIDDPELTGAINKALDMMLMTQMESGGWPHLYPKRGNYHDYATFNDGGINDCIRVMIQAHNQYHSAEIEKGLRKAAQFMIDSRMPMPQPGWAQQYDEFLQPAWARSFEPASLCPTVTVRNIHTLMDLYLVLEDKALLSPIPDALAWLQQIRMENGKWARFVELGTNEPLYYDRDRKRVNSIEELHAERRTGYAYETNLEPELNAAVKRYEKMTRLGIAKYREEEDQNHALASTSKKSTATSENIDKILASQEPSGAWITRNDRFKKTMPGGQRWNGEYEEMDRISSYVFNRNIRILCEYLELSE